MENHNHKVCPLEKAKNLDNLFRRIIQNPKRILRKFVKNGMDVIDVGCGPGFFTIPLSKMVGENGKVVACDLQEGMLNLVKQKIEKGKLKNIILHKTSEDKIGYEGKFDFILAFYIAHEVPNQKNFFIELNSMLNDNGVILLAEPKSRVSKDEFDNSLTIASEVGFDVKNNKIAFSYSAVLSKKK
jgi:ubiquinone/menaquinone biosynthesis C-methylase UbiE